VDTREDSLNRIAGTVIGSAYRVANGLGPGFLEKVYENALAFEIAKEGLRVNQQCPIAVKYDGVTVGDFCADMLVEHRVLVELKAVKAFDEIHMAQCINYLRATGLTVCLRINFGSPKVQIKRIVNEFGIRHGER
jgi:GxxExxY protein